MVLVKDNGSEGKRALKPKMSESNNNQGSTLVVTLTIDQFMGLIHQEMQKASNGNSHHDGDHLLDAEEAAKTLAVSPDWLYRHANKLPFTRKLAPKMLRFSYLGLQKWLASRKTS